MGLPVAHILTLQRMILANASSSTLHDEKCIFHVNNTSTASLLFLGWTIWITTDTTVYTYVQQGTTGKLCTLAYYIALHVDYTRLSPDYVHVG
jgi:hypothetical protein